MLPRPEPRTRLRFRWAQEDDPGAEWLALFERAWTSYRRWFLRDGDDARPDVEESRTRLAEHMPELVPVWERLTGLAAHYVGGGADTDLAARLLALYRPPRYITGCSQAVWTDGAPVLVRNYDYHPHAFEGTVVRSSWLGTSVMATSDCLWGALDGMNEHGLAVALAFGGRAEAGDGFGIPLILRYVLEVSATVADAIEVLRRVPSHMSYNVSLLDRAGAHAVAYLRPGHPTRVAREAACTNHQPGSARSAYARATRSVERKRTLTRALDAPGGTIDGLVERFLEAPLHVTGYERGYGTLYTVAYRPETGAAEYVWRDARVRQTLSAFTPREMDLALG